MSTSVSNRNTENERKLKWMQERMGHLEIMYGMKGEDPLGKCTIENIC